MNTEVHSARSRARSAALIAGLATAALLLAACSGGSGATDTPSTSAGPTGNGPATLWVRSADEALDQKLVDGWNADHPDQAITMVTIPDAEYVQKLLQAVRSDDAPDIAVLDIANAAALTSEGVLMDVTSQVDALSYSDQLAPAAINVCTVDGKVYCLPHQLDISLLYYNKTLFERAGLDPNSPPTTSAEVEADAAAIRALGGDTYGYYFAGNCAGCNAYTTLPMIWANGGDILADSGATATVDDPAVIGALDSLKTMWDAGSIPAAARDETGATWINSFQSGQIGMIGLGSFGIAVFGADPTLDYGITAIPGVDGGTSAFLGGDVAGVTATAKNATTAWDFLDWTMSDEVQEGIVAATNLVVRSDLTDNATTAANPMLQQANELISIAQVPVTPKYNALFIDTASPFLQLIRDYVFAGDPAAVQTAQSAFEQKIGG